MVKRYVVVACLLVSVAPLEADLTVVSKVEVRKVETTDPPNPFMAMAGQAMAAQFAAMNGTETTIYIGDGVVRSEMSGAAGGLPQGTATIVRADGSMVVLNTTDQTYFTSSMPDLGPLLQGGVKPTFVIERTGQTDRLLGHTLQQVMVAMTMPLPIPPEAISQLPEGFPTVIEMSIEAWATETYASYGRQMLQGNPMMAALGLSELADIGFVLRQVVRSPMLGGYEMETTVTSISESDLSPGLFAVPPGYRQVAAPPGAGRGGGPIDKASAAR